MLQIFLSFDILLSRIRSSTHSSNQRAVFATPCRASRILCTFAPSIEPLFQTDSVKRGVVGDSSHIFQRFVITFKADLFQNVIDLDNFYRIVCWFSGISSSGGTTALACINTLRKLASHPLMIFNDCLQSDASCIDNRCGHFTNFQSCFHVSDCRLCFFADSLDCSVAFLKNMLHRFAISISNNLMHMIAWSCYRYPVRRKQAMLQLRLTFRSHPPSRHPPNRLSPFPFHQPIFIFLIAASFILWTGFWPASVRLHPMIALWSSQLTPARWIWLSVCVNLEVTQRCVLTGWFLLLVFCHHLTFNLTHVFALQVHKNVFADVFGAPFQLAAQWCFHFLAKCQSWRCWPEFDWRKSLHPFWQRLEPSNWCV